MKKVILAISLISLSILLIAFLKENFRTHSIVKVKDTKLCIPKSYELMVDVPFLWTVEDLDEDAAGGLFLIPAGEIAKEIQGYRYSHINQHKVDLKHNISGIIWSEDQIATPNGMAKKAWQLIEGTDYTIAKFNSSLNLYEIGDERYIDIWWHLAKTSPKRSSEQPSSDWYLGYCHGDKPDNYTCSRFLKYKNVYFDYDIQAIDIPLVEKVEGFILSKFKAWERECQS